ncbi:class I adenylate-forming enzyme family protein [Ammoniphilus sp. 3BR4]|uniref:class I adenylate-forming enzyme family protein n=1 Tax=Ammoniphilus sp. 3BR4 TaxID=3158265 RepID=UPI003467555B
MGQFDFVLKDMYNKALPFFGSKIAVKCDGKEMSYDQLNLQANRLAHGLIRSGIGLEDPVAMLMSNCIEFPVTDIAILKAGATKVPLNDMLGEKEILYILQNSESKAAVVDSCFYPIIAKIREQLPHLKTVIALSNSAPPGFIPWDQFLQGMPDKDPMVNVKPHHRALIGYTGGTTGSPKGIVQTQQNQVMNLICHIIELGINDQDIILAMTPLPHSAGRYIMTGLVKGATHIVGAKFDPVQTLRLIEQERVTFTFMVPTMIYRVLDVLKQTSFDISSIRTIMYGAAPITEERLKQGLKMFGQVFYQFFGLTEAPNFVTRLTKADHSLEPDKIHRLRSCGTPPLMSQVKIINDKGEEVPRGEQGEICVKAPFVMEGYHKLPDKTAETIMDGWLHTGDVGKMDEDGYVYLLDRKKDMIISGGMNVYSTEVENAIQQVPGVRQVAVIGIPHIDWGEKVMAVIIPDPDNPPSEEGILQFCKENLAKYKQPKEIKFLSELPLTAYGKIDKKALRQPYWQDAARSIH